MVEALRGGGKSRIRICPVTVLSLPPGAIRSRPRLKPQWPRPTGTSTVFCPTVGTALPLPTGPPLPRSRINLPVRFVQAAYSAVGVRRAHKEKGARTVKGQSGNLPDGTGFLRY